MNGKRFAGVVGLLAAACAGDGMDMDVADCVGERCDSICVAAQDPQLRCGQRPLNPRYDCPTTIDELKAEDDDPDGRSWCFWPDAGHFDHRGVCFREAVADGGGGNQCCYSLESGVDNCTGTYDEVGVASRHGLFPHSFSAAGQDYTFKKCHIDLSQPSRHCNIDVWPWCDTHCQTKCVRATLDTAAIEEETCNAETTRPGCYSHRSLLTGAPLCDWEATHCELEFAAINAEPGGECEQFARAADDNQEASSACNCGLFDREIPFDEELYSMGMDILNMIRDSAGDGDTN